MLHQNANTLVLRQQLDEIPEIAKTWGLPGRPGQTQVTKITTNTKVQNIGIAANTQFNLLPRYVVFNMNIGNDGVALNEEQRGLQWNAWMTNNGISVTDYPNSAVAAVRRQCGADGQPRRARANHDHARVRLIAYRRAERRDRHHGAREHMFPAAHRPHEGPSERSLLPKLRSRRSLQA